MSAYIYCTRFSITPRALSNTALALLRLLYCLRVSVCVCVRCACVCVFVKVCMCIWRVTTIDSDVHLIRE